MILKNRYNQAMEKIKVTNEMQERILKGVNETDFHKSSQSKNRFFLQKKYLMAAACLVIFLASIVTVPNLLQIEKEPNTQVIPNSMNYDTKEELINAVGFEIYDIKEVPFEIKQTTYTAFGTDLAEILYEGEEERVFFRMSRGEDDNSGDYTEYSVVDQILVDNQKITIKGEKDGYNLAIWEDNGYSYSIYSSVNCSKGEVIKMLKSAKK